jgi:hypothetical protein
MANEVPRLQRLSVAMRAGLPDAHYRFFVKGATAEKNPGWPGESEQTKYETKSTHKDQFRSICSLIFQHIGLEVSRANVIVTHIHPMGQ